MTPTASIMGGYSARALAYFATHGIDPAVATAVGVTEEGGCLLYPYGDGDGAYERRRPLDGKTRQPLGRRLTCWWPGGRSGVTALVCEGEGDALAALTAIRDADTVDPVAASLLRELVVVAVPSASFPADRLAGELRGIERVILAPDNDKAGDSFADRAAEALRAAGIVCARLPFSGGDLADYLVATEDPADALAQSVADAEADTEAPSRTGQDSLPPARLTIRADEVRSRSIRFAWTGRLAIAYLTVLTGIEGLGKSLFAAWVIARLTRGKLPGDWHGRPVNVLIIAGEDGIADTWRPRLDLADADTERASFLDLDKLDPGWNVRDGIEQLKAAVDDSHAQMIFIDAALDHMPAPRAGESINSPTFVRQALGPLRRLACERELVVVFSMHPPKARSADFRDLVQSSQAFSAVPRVGLLFAYHPHDDPGDPKRRRVLIRGKGNIGRDPGALSFRVAAKPYRHDDGRTCERELVTDVEPCAITMADLAPDRLIGATREPTKTERAVELLRAVLADGGWHLANDAHALLDEQGVGSASVLREAKRLARVRTRKQPGVTHGPWEWSIASDDALTPLPSRARSLTAQDAFAFEGENVNNNGKASRRHGPQLAEASGSRRPGAEGYRAPAREGGDGGLVADALARHAEGSS